MPDVASIPLGESSASFLRAARAGNVTELVELLKAGTDINTCNANGLNALHIASKEGHADVVEELLTRGARVDAATKKGNTALHIASLAGQMEVVELLINHGANPNVQSQDGFTPLYMAAQENHDGVVVYLLQHGANQSLATEEGFTPLAVALQQGHDRVVAILLENDTRGKVRLPALHIAAKKDDTKAAALLLQSDHNPDVTSKSGFTPLHIAAHYGNENIAKMLLEKGANVNFMARHNITPLHVAAKWGRGNLVALLLAHGAVIDCRTRDLLTPLHCAARSGHDQIVDLLLEKGAPISAKSKNGLAPLHTAAQGDHVDTARILLYHRAPVDEVTVDYLTPLHIAAHYGHVQTAKLLLDRNADPNSRALNGFTPLHVACKKNRIKVVELLLKYQAALEATTESGLTPLHVAAFMGCMNIVVYLMQHGANPDVVTIRGETPLHLATRAYQTDVVRILLRNGATVDATAREGQTPLHIASRLGNADIVMLLLQHGAKVDAPTRDQYTPLHTAAKEGQEEVVALLLDHGASHELQTSKGFKPIHLAAKYGNYPVVEALLEKGADVDAQGKNQVTPLHVAAHYNHEKVALLLLEHKASPRAAAKNGYTPLHIVAKKNQLDIAPVLLEYQADVNAESKAGFTPLHLASQEGHVGMVLFLLEHGAEVNAQARNGLTPMHLCAQDDRVEVAQVLKDHGANLSPRTKAGYTPLHVACHFGQINMVKFLLENGADLNAATSLGYTPLHQAAQQGHGIIVKLLLDEGASPNVLTSNGQTPLSIAQKLGYVSVVETLRTITETTVITETTTITEERYKVQSPETMQETFISESEDEGDDAYARSLERDLDGLSSLRPFSDLSDVYLNGTSQFMDTSGFGSLRRHSPSSRSSDFYSSLPRRQHQHRSGDGIGKLRYAEEGGVAGSLSFEKEMHQPMEALQDESLLPMDKSLEAEQLQLESLIRKVQEQPFTPSGSDYRLEDAFSPDNVDATRLALHSGFLVSFLVDARGGAMRGCRHSGVRIIVPPRKAPMPMRITCRYLRREKLIHPPPLNEGEALASRILEMGPAGAKFLGPVIIEVPHFASLRGREREIVLMRSEDGEHWKEHALEATEDAVQEVLNESFNPEELSQIEDLNTTRITRILTNDFPQYFALVTRIRQEVHAVGPEGGMIASTVVPQVQALFPEGALTKTIKVSLQAQAIPQDLVNKLHGNRVAVSPIVTVEPRRRKFHKPITLCIPLPQSTNKGMITQYSAQTGQDPPTLRLLCSIVGGTAPAQWEDITGTTQLTFSNDNVSFTTTVSARFWLMDCQTPRESARMAQEIYNDGIVVPYMAKFVVFARRLHPTEGQLRLFCVTDDKEDKTLERQEHYQEIAKSRDVEVLSGRPQYLEFVGNLIPVTKSGEQLSMHFFPFQENRLMFYLKLRDVDDPNAAAAGRVAIMRESRQRSENLPPQHPICTLAITLPNYSGAPPSDVRLVDGRRVTPTAEKPTVYETSWESRDAFTPNYVSYQSTPKVPPAESAYFAPSPQAIAQEVAPVRPERRVSNIAPAKTETVESQEYVLSKTPDNLEDAEPYLVESPVVERKDAEIDEERTVSPIITEPASSEEGYPLEQQRESLESSLASSERSSDTVVASPRDKGARLPSLPSKTARLSYKEGSSSETSTLSARSPTAPDEISSEWTADRLSPFMQNLAYEESNLLDAQEGEATAGRVDLRVNLRRSADSAVMSGTIPDTTLVTRGVAEVRRMRGERFPSYEAPSSELMHGEADDKWAARNYGAEEASTAMGDDWRLPGSSEKQVTLNVRLRKGEDQFNSVAIIPEGSRVAPTATDVQRRTGEVNELRLEELEAPGVPLERRLVEAVGDEGKGDAVEGPGGDSSLRLAPLDRSSASDSSFVPLQDELETSVVEVSGLSLEDDEVDPTAVPLRRSLTPRADEQPVGGGYHLIGERRVPANGVICRASSDDLSSQQSAPSAQPLLLDSPLLYSGEPKLVEMPDESRAERSVDTSQPRLGPWSGGHLRKEEDSSLVPEEICEQDYRYRSPSILVSGTYLGQPVVAGMVTLPVEAPSVESGRLLMTGDTPFVKLHLDRDASGRTSAGTVPKDSDVIVRECQEYLALLDEGQAPSFGSKMDYSAVVGGLFLGSPVVQSTFTTVDDRGAPLRSLQDLPDVKTSQETETVEEGFIEGDGRVVSTKKITRVVTTTRTMTTGKDGPKVEETRVTTQQVMDGSGRPVVVEEVVSTPGPSSGGAAPNEPPRQQPLIRLKVDDAVFNGVLDKNAHIKLTPAEGGKGEGGGGGEPLNAAASYRPSVVGSAEQRRGVLEREFLPPPASTVKSDQLPLKLQEMSPVEEYPPHEWQPSRAEDESLPVTVPEEPVSVRERIRRFEGMAIDRISSLFGRRRASEVDQPIETRRAAVAGLEAVSDESASPFPTLPESSISRSFTLTGAQPLAEATTDFSDLLAVERPPYPDTELLSHLSEKPASIPDLPVRLSFAEHNVVIPEVTTVEEEQPVAQDTEDAEYPIGAPEPVVSLRLEPDGLGEWLGMEEMFMLPIHSLFFTEPNLSDEFIAERVETVSPAELQFGVVEPASLEDVSDKVPISERSSEAKFGSLSVSADSELYDYEIVSAESPSLSPTKEGGTRPSFMQDIPEFEYYPKEVVEHAEFPARAEAALRLSPLEPSASARELPEGMLSIDRSGLTTESKLFKSVLRTRFDGMLPDERVERQEERPVEEPLGESVETVERSFTKMQLPHRFECDYVVPEVPDVKLSADYLFAVQTDLRPSTVADVPVTSVETGLTTCIRSPEQVGIAEQLVYKTESNIRLVNAQPISTCSHVVAAEFRPLTGQDGEAFAVQPHASLVSGLVNVREASVDGVVPSLIVRKGMDESAELMIVESPEVNASQVASITIPVVIPSTVAEPSFEVRRVTSAEELMTGQPFHELPSEELHLSTLLAINKAEEVEQSSYAVKQPRRMVATSDLRQFLEARESVVAEEEEVVTAAEIEAPLISSLANVKSTVRGIPREQTWFVAQVETEDEVPAWPLSFTYAAPGSLQEFTEGFSSFAESVSESGMAESLSIAKTEEHQCASAILLSAKAEEQVALPLAVALEAAGTPLGSPPGELRMEGGLAKEAHVNLAFEWEADERFASADKQFEHQESVEMTSAFYESPYYPQEYVGGPGPEFPKEESVSVEESFSAYPPEDVRDRRGAVRFECEHSIPLRQTVSLPRLSVENVSLALSKEEDRERAVLNVDETERLAGGPLMACSMDYGVELVRPITSESSQLEIQPREPSDFVYAASDLLEREAEYPVGGFIEKGERLGEMFEAAQGPGEMSPRYKSPAISVESREDYAVELVKEPSWEESPVLGYPVFDEADIVGEALVQESVSERSAAVQETWVTFSKKELSQGISTVIRDAQRSAAVYQSIAERSATADVSSFPELAITESTMFEPTDELLEEVTVGADTYAGDEIEGLDMSYRMRLDGLERRSAELIEQPEPSPLSVLAPLSPGLVDVPAQPLKEEEISVEEEGLVGPGSPLVTERAEVASPLGSPSFLNEQFIRELRPELLDEERVGLQPSALVYSHPDLEDETSGVTPRRASPIKEWAEEGPILDKSLELFRKESSEAAAAVIDETRRSSATSSVSVQTVFGSEYDVDVQAFTRDQPYAMRASELSLRSHDFISAEVGLEDSLVVRSRSDDVEKADEGTAQLEPCSLAYGDAGIVDREIEYIVPSGEGTLAEQTEMESDFGQVIVEPRRSPSPPVASPVAELLPEEAIPKPLRADEEAISTEPSVLFYSAAGLQDASDEFTLESEYGVAESMAIQDSQLAFSKGETPEHATVLVQDTEEMTATAVLTERVLAVEKSFGGIPYGVSTEDFESAAILLSQESREYQTREIAMFDSFREGRILSPEGEMTELGMQALMEAKEVDTLKQTSLFPTEEGLVDLSPEVPFSLGEPEPEQEIVRSASVSISFSKLESAGSATVILGSVTVSSLPSLVFVPSRSLEYEEFETRPVYGEPVEVAPRMEKLVDERTYFEEPSSLAYSPTDLEEPVVHEGPFLPAAISSVPSSPMFAPGGDDECRPVEELTEEAQVRGETEAAEFVEGQSKAEESVSIEPSFLAYSPPGLVDKEMAEPVFALAEQVSFGEYYGVEPYSSPVPAWLTAEKKEETAEATALIGPDERASSLANVAVALADSVLASFSRQELGAGGYLERASSEEIELSLPPATGRAAPLSVDEASKELSILPAVDAVTQVVTEVAREQVIGTAGGEFETFSQEGVVSEKPLEPSLLVYSAPGLLDKEATERAFTPMDQVSVEKDGSVEQKVTAEKAEDSAMATALMGHDDRASFISNVAVALADSVLATFTRPWLEGEGYPERADLPAEIDLKLPVTDRAIPFSVGETYGESPVSPPADSSAESIAEVAAPREPVEGTPLGEREALTEAAFVHEKPFEQSFLTYSFPGLLDKEVFELDRAPTDRSPEEDHTTVQEPALLAAEKWEESAEATAFIGLVDQTSFLSDVVASTESVLASFTRQEREGDGYRESLKDSSAEVELSLPATDRAILMATDETSKGLSILPTLDASSQGIAEMVAGMEPAIGTFGGEYESTFLVYSSPGLIDKEVVEAPLTHADQLWEDHTAKQYATSMPTWMAAEKKEECAEAIASIGHDERSSVLSNVSLASSDSALTAFSRRELEDSDYLEKARESSAEIELSLPSTTDRSVPLSVGTAFEPFSLGSREGYPEPAPLFYSFPGVEDVQPSVCLTSEEPSVEQDLSIAKLEESEEATFVIGDKGAAFGGAVIAGLALPVTLGDSAVYVEAPLSQMGSPEPQQVEVYPSEYFESIASLEDTVFSEQQRFTSTARAETTYTAQKSPGEFVTAVSITEPSSAVAQAEFAERRLLPRLEPSPLVYSEPDLTDDVGEFAVSKVFDSGFAVTPELITTATFASVNAADADVVVKQPQNVFASSDVASEQAVSPGSVPKAETSSFDSYLRDVIFDQETSGGADWLERSLVDTVFPEEILRPLHRGPEAYPLRVDLDSGLEEPEITPSSLQSTIESEQLSKEESIDTEITCEPGDSVGSASLLLGKPEIAEGALTGTSETVVERAAITKEPPLGAVELKASSPDWISKTVSTAAPPSLSEDLVSQPAIVYGYSGAVESLFVLPRSTQEASCICISDLSRGGQVVETAYSAPFDHGTAEQAVAQLSAVPVIRTDTDDADRVALVYGYSNAVEGVCICAQYAPSTDSVVSGEDSDEPRASQLLAETAEDEKFSLTDLSTGIESGALSADVMTAERRGQTFTTTVFDETDFHARQIPSHLVPDSTVLPLDVIPSDLFPVSGHPAVLSPIEGSPITPPRQETEQEGSQSSTDGQISTPESLWSDVSTVREVFRVRQEDISRSGSEPSVEPLGRRRPSSVDFAPTESAPATGAFESPSTQMPLGEEYTVSSYPLSTEIYKEKVVSDAFDRSTSASVESHLYSAFSRSQESLASVTRSVVEMEVKESSPASFTCPPEPPESGVQYVHTEGETKTEMRFTERVMGMFGSMLQGLGRKKVAAVEKVEHEQVIKEESKQAVVVQPEAGPVSERLRIEHLLKIEPDELVELIPHSPPTGEETGLQASVPAGEGLVEQQEEDTFVPGEGPAETEMMGDTEGTMITEYKEDVQVTERGWVKKTYRVVVEKRKSSTFDTETVEPSSLESEQVLSEEQRWSMEELLARSPERSAVSGMIQSYEQQGEEALTSLEGTACSADLSARATGPERVHLSSLEMPSTEVERSSEIIKRRFIFAGESQKDSLEDVGMAPGTGSEERASITGLEGFPSSDVTDQARPTWAETLFKSRPAVDRPGSMDERRYSTLVSTGSVDYLVDDVLAEASSQMSIEGTPEQPEWFQITTEKPPMYFERTSSMETFRWSFPSSVDVSRQESRVEVEQAERAAEASLFVALTQGEQHADAVVTIHRPELSPDSLGLASQPEISYLLEKEFQYPDDSEVKEERQFLSQPSSFPVASDETFQYTLQLTPELPDAVAISEASLELVGGKFDKASELKDYSVDVSLDKPPTSGACEGCYLFEGPKESVAEKIAAATQIAEAEPTDSEVSVPCVEATRLEGVEGLESELREVMRSIVEGEVAPDRPGSFISASDTKAEIMEHIVRESEKLDSFKALVETASTDVFSATPPRGGEFALTTQVDISPLVEPEGSLATISSPIYGGDEQVRKPAEEGVCTSSRVLSEAPEAIDKSAEKLEEHKLRYVDDSGLQLISPIAQVFESPVLEGERAPATEGTRDGGYISELLEGDTITASEVDMLESAGVSCLRERYFQSEDMEEPLESCELEGSFSFPKTVPEVALTLYENAYQSTLAAVTADQSKTLTGLEMAYGISPDVESVSLMPVGELPPFLEADLDTISFVDSVIRTAQMEVAKVQAPYSDEVKTTASVHQLTAGPDQEPTAEAQTSCQISEGSSLFHDVPSGTVKVESKLGEFTEHAHEEPTSVEFERALYCDDSLPELPQELKEKLVEDVGSEDEPKQTEVRSLFRSEEGCLELGEMPENVKRDFGFAHPLLPEDESLQYDRELPTDYEAERWTPAAESYVEQSHPRDPHFGLASPALGDSSPAAHPIVEGGLAALLEAGGTEGSCLASQTSETEWDKPQEQIGRLTGWSPDGEQVTSAEGRFTPSLSNLYHPEEEMGESRWHRWDTHEGPKEPPGVKYPEEATLEHDERLSYEQHQAALAGAPYYPEDEQHSVLMEPRKQESKGVEHLITPSDRDTAIEESMFTFGTASETGDTSGEATRVSPDNSLSAEYHTPKQTSPTESDSLQGYSVASESDAERMVEMHGYDDWLGEPAGPFLMSAETQREMFEGALRSDLSDSERLPTEDSFSSVRSKHVDSAGNLSSLDEHAKGEEKVEEDGSQEDVIAKQKLEFVVERYPAVEVEHVLRYEELEEERFRLVHSGSESFGSDIVVPEMVVADQSSSDAALSSDEVTEVMSTSQSVDSQIPCSFDATYPEQRSERATVHPLTYEELPSETFEPQVQESTNESLYSLVCEHSKQQKSLKPEALFSYEQSSLLVQEETEAKERSQAETPIMAATSRDSKDSMDVPAASAAELASSADRYEPLYERAYPIGTLKYDELGAESFRPDDACLAKTVSGPSMSTDSEWIRRPSMPMAYEFTHAFGKSEMWIQEESDYFGGLLSAAPRDVEAVLDRASDEGPKTVELFQEEVPSEPALVPEQFGRLSPDSLQEERTYAAAEPGTPLPAAEEEIRLVPSALVRDSRSPMSPGWSSQQVTEPKESYGDESTTRGAPKVSEERAASEETDADWVMVSMMETAPSLEQPVVSPGVQEPTEGQEEGAKERLGSDNALSLSADSLDGAEPTEESPVSEVAVSVRSAEAALEVTSEEENNSPRRRLFRPRIRSKQGSLDNVSDTASLLEFERLEREVTLRGGGESLSGSEAELMVIQAKRRCSNGSQSSLAEFERLERELDESVTAGREERAHGQNGDTTDVMLLSDIKEESETEELSSVSGRQTAASFDQRSLSFGDQEESLQKLDSGMTTPEYVPECGYQVERIEDQVEPCMVTSIDSLEGELPVEPQAEAPSAQMPTISLVSSDSLEGYRERTDTVRTAVPEAPFAIGGMKLIGDFALSDRDSLIASSTSEMSADDGQETGVAEKSELVSSDTMASFQEYGDEGERDSLCGDYKTGDDEALSTPVDETRLPFSVGVVGSASPRVTSSGGIGAGGDFATTITRFETHRALDDGCMEVITRTVSTRVTDPVSTRIRFTGADSAAQSVQSITARPPTYEEFTSTDEMGNVTRTVVRRISAAEISGLHDVDGSAGVVSMSETGSLGGSRSQARTPQGDVSIERREYRRSYGEIRSSRNHLSDGDNQPPRRPTLLRQGDRRSRRRSNGVERKSPDSDGSSDSLDAFSSNA